MLHPDSPLCKHLTALKDPRRHNTRHRLHDIFLIALCAIISGADSWVQVEQYGRAKLDWFKEFLELPHGIPSHDTFGRLFARLDPQGLQDFFRHWLQDLSASLSGKTVAIDGKTLRGSRDQANGGTALHLVSAWVSELGLVLGQLKTPDKSNEIKVIPELLNLIDLHGAVVTIDALGCQKKIAQTIIAEEADYVLQVKNNQRELRENIALFFQGPNHGPFDTCQTVDGEHGRIETRRYYTTGQIGWLPGKAEWPGINSICMAVREREVKGKTTTETAYFISSLESHAPTIAQAIRDHWGIENGLHWCLDIAFREDHCRVRQDHAPENLAILRHLAINLLKRETSLKVGIQTKRLRAAWDQAYLLKLLST